MTDKPTPHRPMSRADWDATNEHARQVLHPAPANAPAATEHLIARMNEISERMANADTVAYLTTYGRRETFNKDYRAAEDMAYILIALGIQTTKLDAARAEIARLRDRAALTDEEQRELRPIRLGLKLGYALTLTVDQCKQLDRWLDRLTSPDPRSDGDA